MLPLSSIGVCDEIICCNGSFVVQLGTLVIKGINENEFSGNLEVFFVSSFKLRQEPLPRLLQSVGLYPPDRQTQRRSDDLMILTTFCLQCV